MITKENVLVFDIDGTLCEIRRKDQTYLEVEPKHDMVEKLKQYKEKGFYIILYTSRQMCGVNGFYIDDKAVRPKEFLENSYEEILKLIGEE